MIHTVSITDLKQNTATVINKVKNLGKPVVIMQRSQAAAVLVDPQHYSVLEAALEDLEDLRDIELRKNEPGISFEDYYKKRFGEKSYMKK